MPNTELTIADFQDLVEKYNNKEFTFEEFSKLFNERYNKLKNDLNNIKPIDLINKQIITNN